MASPVSTKVAPGRHKSHLSPLLSGPVRLPARCWRTGAVKSSEWSRHNAGRSKQGATGSGFPKGGKGEGGGRSALAMGLPGWRPREEALEQGFSMFQFYNRNKLCMTSDLTKPKGLDILRRLVKISDLFIENNTPSTMDKLGITYEWLKEVKPDIIMIRMPAYGPERSLQGLPLLWLRSGKPQQVITWLRGYTGYWTRPWRRTAVAHCDAAGGANAALGRN